MNLIDAIKSGYDFKATHGDDSMWMYVDPIGLDRCTPCVKWRSDDKLVYLVPGMFDDVYEIQEPTVTITRSQLLKAFEESAFYRTFGGYWVISPTDLARKLGLEEP